MDWAGAIKRLAPTEPRDPAFVMGNYFLLAGLDDEERDLVTVSTEPSLPVGLLLRITRRAWRVSIWVRPPGTSARTMAWPTR